MEEETIRAFAAVVERSLQTEVGQEWLNRSNAMLYRAFGKHNFNTERAAEMYGMAIERAVLAMLGNTGPMTIMTLRESGITAKMAMELANSFKEATGARDQRPARRGIVGKLFGK